jgi:hypothetical protein
MASQAQSAQDVLIFEEAGSPVGNLRAAQDVLIFEGSTFPTHTMNAAQDVLLFEIPIPKVITQILGNFQDPSGNPIANGSLTVRLNMDAMGPGSIQVSADRLITMPLDQNGNLSGLQYLWANSLLSTPYGVLTSYIMTVYSALGQQIWQQQITVPNATSFNIGSWSTDD